jgi:ABC-type Fe3+ transport system substrate-binding protein
MRQYVFLGLFFVVLVTPFVVRNVIARNDRPGAPAAVSGSAPELVIVTPHNQDIRRTFASAFSDWHQQRFGAPVRITYLTPGGTNDIIRMLYDIYDAQRDPQTRKLPQDENDVNISIDLVWGGGDTTFDRELKPPGILKPVKLDERVLAEAFPSRDLNGVPLYERTADGSPPRWVGVVLSSFGIIYSPVLYATLKLPAPTRWDDLARPELAALVALADPTRSGSAAVAYMMVLQRAMADAEADFLKQHAELGSVPTTELATRADYQAALAAGWKRGMGTLVLTAANARYFTDSGPQVPSDVGNGDAAAGIAIDFYARVFEQEIGSDRIRFITPTNATAITPDPIAILYGVTGEREIIANRFIEFLLTPDAQRLWNLDAGHSPHVERSLRRLPIRRDVYADRTGWIDRDSDPFVDAGDFNIRQEWMRLFSDIRSIWAAAWIDSRSSLKSAYAQVLCVEDGPKRERLLLELSDIPVELADVAAQNRKRRELESAAESGGEDPRLWATRQRVIWAKMFREHYDAVGAVARAARDAQSR